MTRTVIILQTTAILLLAFLGCNRKSATGNLIDEDTFVDLYVEVAIAQESQLGEKNLEEIFARYHLTEEKFHTLIEFYQNNPEKWMGLYRKIVERLKVMKGQKIKPEILGKPKSEPPP